MRRTRTRTIVAIVVASHVVGAYFAFASWVVEAWIWEPGFDVIRDPSYDVLGIAPLSYPVVLLEALNDPRFGAFETALLCLGYIVPAVATAIALISRAGRARPSGRGITGTAT